MPDKLLTEATWKAFAKAEGHEDAGLNKALGALLKAEKEGPEDELKALDDLDKQMAALRSGKKSDKVLGAQLDKMGKAADAQRKAAEKALKAQKDAEESEAEEEEDSPAVLTSKLIPLLKQVRKGDVVMSAMIATAGKDTAVMLARRAIAPARSKVLKDYLGTASGVKVILGECLLEENAVTFVVQSQAAGLAKKLKAALLAQTDLKLKVRVRGLDPKDVDEVGEEDDAPESGTAGQNEPEGQQADPAQQRFDERLAQLQPLLSAALREARGDPGRMRAVAEFAIEKGRGGNPSAGLKALDTLEGLIKGAASPGTASGTAPGSPLDGAMQSWRGARADVIQRIQSMLAEVREDLAEDPSDADARDAELELNALMRQLTAEPSSAEQVKSLLTWVGSDDVVAQVDGYLGDVRAPLMTALGQLQQAMGQR